MFSDSQENKLDSQRRETVYQQQIFQKIGFDLLKQKYGTVHSLLEKEGFECSFDKKSQRFLANLCDLFLSYI